MKLPRSFRKSIAASLALTMLTIPLAGCGSGRGLISGGITGKGVLGDLAVGGFYGGVMGGFFGGEKLPEGAFTVELPRPNDLRLAVELLGMDALRYYTHARIATEKLSRMDKKNSKPEECAKLMKEAADLWKLADQFTDMAEKLAKRLAEEEKKPGYKPLAMIDRSPFGGELFFSIAYAREGTDADEAKFAPTDRSNRELWERSQQWSEDIVNEYGKYPAGKGIAGLAKTLGVDAKEANRQFQKALKNLDQDKIFGIPTGISNETAGKLYDVGVRTAAVTKGTCQVGLVVGGMILSAPLLGPGAAGAAMQGAVMANWTAGGVDTVIEVANDLHIASTGDSNKELDKIKGYTGAISALTSGVMLATSFSNFALTGEQAIKNTHDTLQAANLNTAGLLDNYNIGGAGVSALFDSAIWGTDRISELAGEGKFLGIKVINRNGAPAFVPQVISQDTARLPMSLENVPLSDLDGMTTVINEANQKAINNLLDTIKKLEQEKQNVINQMAQDAEKETRALTDAPFATSKLAGYYSVQKINGSITSSGTVRAINETTIRCVETDDGDSRSKPEIFTATIDPMTGSGTTSEGYPVQFSKSGSSYSVTFANHWGQWRGHKN